MNEKKNPVSFNVAYPASLSRGTLLLKTFLGIFYGIIPHAIVLGILGMISSIIYFLAFWIILFTGNFPKGMFEFVEGVMRWGCRFGAYFALMTDVYPPFSMKEIESHPVKFSVEYPETLSRGTLLLKVILGSIYVGIPHGIVLGLLSTLAEILVFLSWWTILFTGKMPEGFFNLIVGCMRWNARVSAYMGLMTDVYPPFSMD